MRLIIFVIVIVFGLLCVEKSCAQGRRCYTPDGYYGNCLRLSRCPPLYDYYRQNRRNPQTASYFQVSERNCGRNFGFEAVVCCQDAESAPSTEAPFYPTPNVPEEIPPSPPTQPPLPPPTQPPSPPPTPVTQPYTQPFTQPITEPSTPSPRTSERMCNDPNGLAGTCTYIKDCATIQSKLLDQAKRGALDPEFHGYIYKSNVICTGSQPQKQEICCPFEGQARTERPRAQLSGRIMTVEEGCGFSNATHKRIVGGQKAKPGAYPWMALIGYVNSLGISDFKCGGSLITSRHILSAAHCVTSTLSFARLGEHDLSVSDDGDTQDIKIVKSERHPSYNKRDGTSDISVLYLDHDADFSLRVKPICMPFDAELRSFDFTGYQPFVAGWGYLKEGGKSSNVLQELQLPILDNEVCKGRYLKQNKLFSDDQFDNRVLCAGYLEGGKDACQGDSGGPLMQPLPRNSEIRYFEIGVVSYGIGCARTDTPGVYTRVQHFMDWILEKLNE